MNERKDVGHHSGLPTPAELVWRDLAQRLGTVAPYRQPNEEEVKSVVKPPQTMGTISGFGTAK